jgi:hypothetical protein
MPKEEAYRYFRLGLNYFRSHQPVIMQASSAVTSQSSNLPTTTSR